MSYRISSIGVLGSDPSFSPHSLSPSMQLPEVIKGTKSKIDWVMVNVAFAFSFAVLLVIAIFEEKLDLAFESLNVK